MAVELAGIVCSELAYVIDITIRVISYRFRAFSIEKGGGDFQGVCCGRGTAGGSGRRVAVTQAVPGARSPGARYTESPGRDATNSAPMTLSVRWCILRHRQRPLSGTPRGFDASNAGAVSISNLTLTDRRFTRDGC